MADRKLVDFINKSLKRGIDEQNILNSLLKKGWKKNLVEDAFSFVKGSQVQENPFENIDNSQEVVKEETPEETKVSEEKPEKVVKKNKKEDLKKEVEEEKLRKENKSFKKEEKENPLKTMIIMVVLLGFLVGIFLLFGFTSKTLVEGDLVNGTTIILEEGKSVSFSLEGSHKLTIEKIIGETVLFKLESKVYEFNLSVGNETKIDFGNDGDYDLLIRVVSVSDEVEIYLSKLSQDFCEENWECGEWSECIEGFQNRNCIDLNDCGTIENMPKEIRPCCEENWECGEWSECIEGTQTRNCIDLNKCETEFEKPAETKKCDSFENLDNEIQEENKTINLSSEKVLCNSLNGYVCNELEYCNDSLHNIQDSDIICCQEECITASDYFGKSFSSISWSDKINNFKTNATYCESGYSISVNLSTANLQYRTGINTTKRVKFKIIGIDSEGKCKIEGNYSYYNLNYTKEMRDYLLQQGNTTEEINNKIDEMNLDSDSYIETSAICKYSATYLEDKIDEWKSGNYTSAFEDTNGKFEEFNCQGDVEAPLIV
jgi:hypothetical protein